MCALCIVFAGLCVFVDLYVCVCSAQCRDPVSKATFCTVCTLFADLYGALCVASLVCCCCVVLLLCACVLCCVVCCHWCVHVCVLCCALGVASLVCCCCDVVVCVCVVLCCVVLCCVLPLVCSCACVVLCAVVLPLLSMLCECVVLRCVLPRAENQKIPLLLRSPVNTQEQSSRFLSFVFRFQFFLHCIIYEMKPLIYL